MTSVGVEGAAAAAGDRVGLAVGGVAEVDGGVAMVGGGMVLVLVVSAAAIWEAFGFFLVMVPDCDCD